MADIACCGVWRECSTHRRPPVKCTRRNARNQARTRWDSVFHRMLVLKDCNRALHGVCGPYTWIGSLQTGAKAALGWPKQSQRCLARKRAIFHVLQAWERTKTQEYRGFGQRMLFANRTPTLFIQMDQEARHRRVLHARADVNWMEPIQTRERLHLRWPKFSKKCAKREANLSKKFRAQKTARDGMLKGEVIPAPDP